MAVVSVSMPDSLLRELDALIEAHGYSGRSEAIRKGARGLLGEFDDADLTDRQLVCVVSAVFDHGSGAETELSELRHANEELVTSNVHSHAGDACLELFVVEGEIDDIGPYVGRLRTVDGVRAVEHSILSVDCHTSQ